MYHVRIESTPIDDEVAVAFSDDGRPDPFQLADGALARDATVEFNPVRRTLEFTCTVDAASDARLAILLAGSEFDKHLEALGAAGVHIQNAEASPEAMSNPVTEAPADFVTMAEAASILGVDAPRFKNLAQNNAFPPVCGHIDVYSRTAVRRWAAEHHAESAVTSTA
jgi:hypothetical protein